MGVTWDSILTMDALGLFDYYPCRILDIGSSNLYSADAGHVATFIRRHNSSPRRDLDAFALRVQRGSAFSLTEGGANEIFVGEVFEESGMRYESIDVVRGFKTTLVDLNRESLPPHFVGAFDLVLNFGTTEHIINQMNSFRVIHDAAAVGAHMVHQLPAVGFVNHGYYAYTGRFFFDLAGYNGYDVVDYWFEQAAEESPENLYSSVRSYQTHFPVLEQVIARIAHNDRDRSIEQLKLPLISCNIVYRKLEDRPFVLPIETSTSVGEVPLEMLIKYAKHVAIETPSLPEDRLPDAPVREE